MSSPEGSRVSQTEEILGGFTGPHFDEGAAPSVLELYQATHHFYEANRQAIVTPASLVGTLALNRRGYMGRVDYPSVKDSGARAPETVSLGIDTSEQARGLFTWEVHRGEDFFVSHVRATGVSHAIHYRRDNQDRLRDDRIIAEEAEQQWLNTFVVGFINNQHIRRHLAGVRRERAVLIDTVTEAVGKGFDPTKVKRLQDRMDAGLTPLPWKLRSQR